MESVAAARHPLVADTVEVFAATEVPTEAAQQETVGPLLLDDPGHIASHSTLVALAAPATAGAVAVLRFPQSCSI